MSSTPMDWTSIASTVLVFGVGVLAGAFLRRSNHGGRSSHLEKLLNPLDARKLKLAGIRAMNPSRTHKLIMVVRNDLGMGKGKIAAQCAHAAVMCYEKAKVTHEEDLDIWQATGCTKICLKSDDGEQGLRELQRKANDMNLVTALVHDAGHTQVAAGTSTVLGIGPAPSEALSEVTGKLKLL